MEISAIIITYNEERNIERCLRSLEGVADEVIVVDAHSTDRTPAICAGFPSVRLISQAWLGFGPQKNLGIQAARYPYILSLDADEALDEELKTSLKQLLPESIHGVYEVCRLNYYYGKFLRHGFEYPDWKIRVFPKNTGRWNDELVHEKLELPPNTATTRLKGHLLHYTYYRIEEHVRKANQYTSLAAANYAGRKKKSSWLKIIFSPLFTFLQAYILKGGFLDGAHGFVVAVLHAYGVYLKYIKLWEIGQSAKTP
jgi:glycosyltransferase involved in cell wall biosynthesis